MGRAMIVVEREEEEGDQSWSTSVTVVEPSWCLRVIIIIGVRRRDESYSSQKAMQTNDIRVE